MALVSSFWLTLLTHPDPLSIPRREGGKKEKRESVRVTRLKTIQTRFYECAVTSRAHGRETMRIERERETDARSPSCDLRLLKTPFSTLETLFKRFETVFQASS